MAVADVQAIINVRAPIFNASATEAIINMAYEFVGATTFGKYRDTAVAYLVLHWLTLSARAESGGKSGGSSGPVTSLKEGALAAEYAEPFKGGGVGLDAFLAMTSWGIEFANLRAMVTFGARNSAVGTPLDSFVGYYL